MKDLFVRPTLKILRIATSILAFDNTFFTVEIDLNWAIVLSVQGATLDMLIACAS